MHRREILPADVRREDELLLHLLRRFFEADPPDRIDDLQSSGLDWSYLLQNASRHGVMPILHRSLEVAGLQYLPQEARRELETRFQGNSLHNLTLTGELIRLLALFEDQAIPVMPFKGPVLASRLYGDLALRQFGDLDMLMPRAEIFRAVCLLQARGYAHPYHLSKTQEEAFLRCRHHILLHNRDSGMSVEVHWRISPQLCLVQADMDELWLRAEKRDFLGKSVLSLGSEDMLLVLSDHGARHSWRRLAWVCDIAGLIKTERIDWAHLFERAGRDGSQRSVLLALFLANGLLGSPLPQEVHRLIQEDAAVRSLAGKVGSHLFKDRSALESEDPLGPLKEGLLYSQVMESFRNRARYLLMKTTTPDIPDLYLISLPDRLYPLYHLVRPMRVTAKYCQKLWKWLQP